MATPSSFRFLLSALAVGSLAWAAPAFAGDDDLDDLDDAGDTRSSDDEPSDDEPSDEPPAPRADDQGGLEADPDADEEWVVKPDAEESKLEFDDEFEDDTKAQTTAPGQDNSRIYREYVKQIEDYSSDEEALAWEKYLKKYPNSLFRERIIGRMEELSSEMYDEHVEDLYSRTEDAGKAEIRFAQPVLLDSIDPRSKVRVGFEWGFPDWVGFVGDLEYQLFRELSVHGGLHGRYTGMNVETGVRYAIIKSARTQMLLTALGDVHLNLDPMAPGFRPQLGFGKRFNLGQIAYMDTMATAGTDLMLLTTYAGDTQLSPRYIAGLHMTVSPSETVRAYIETSTYLKGLGDDTVPSFFRFNVVTFGIKFVQRRTKTEDRFEAGVGASAPYSSEYWGYHFGAVNGDMNYYLP